MKTITGINKQFFGWTLLFAVILCSGFIGCTLDSDEQLKINAPNLMRDIKAHEVGSVTLDSRFCNAAADFSLDLFKATYSSSKNSMISPVSVLLALAMTANGADGETLSQMENVIGGGMPIAELNRYLHTFAKGLPSQKKALLDISNSIWFKDEGFTANNNFLQTNADYYGADAFKAPFNNQTLSDINAWVSNATKKLVTKILDEISPDEVMYLINTIYFNAEWEKKYEKNDVRDREFTSYNKQQQTVKFLHSTENKYIQGDGVTGFIKPYYGSRYSFAAILPDRDIDIHDYLGSLSGQAFLELIKKAQSTTVKAAMPKFDYDFDVTMNDALKAMGMPDAFDPSKANLTHIGKAWGNLFIGFIKHKTKIIVDERGTKAAAVTIGGITPTSAKDRYFVTLDRPFVYAIIDNETNLPLFIGTLLSAK